MGLPSFFYLLFFKKNDFGEYRLYHPLIDGPPALLNASVNLQTGENREAIESLRQISPELAAASLSFDTSEPPDYVGGRPALGTDIMLARIEDSPKRAIRTDYAEAWLRYGNRVSADYSFNFVPSRSSFAVVAESSGTPIVHYSIEIDPQNFSLETDEKQSKFYTTLDVTIEVRNPEGTLIVANDKEVYFELTPSQVQTIRASPFAYQDNFPLVAGDYSVSVILRNRVISQYTVAEKEISIPTPDVSSPKLIDLILAYESKSGMGEVAEGEVRTFQVGSMRFQPASDNVFVIGDTVHLVTQAFGASPAHRVVFELAQRRPDPEDDREPRRRVRHGFRSPGAREHGRRNLRSPSAARHSRRHGAVEAIGAHHRVAAVRRDPARLHLPPRLQYPVSRPDPAGARGAALEPRPLR